MRHQQDSSVRKLDRVMVSVGVIDVDLPEPTDPLADHRPAFLTRQNGEQGSEQARLSLDLGLEGQLGPRTQTDCDSGFPDCREAARRSVPKACADKFICNFCGPGPYTVKTVVAHRGCSGIS